MSKEAFSAYASMSDEFLDWIGDSEVDVNELALAMCRIDTT